MRIAEHCAEILKIEGYYLHLISKIFARLDGITRHSKTVDVNFSESGRSDRKPEVKCMHTNEKFPCGVISHHGEITLCFQPSISPCSS